MATKSGQVRSAGELLRVISQFVTDAANFPNGGEWTLMSPATIDNDSSEVILRGCGDGKDEIYVGLRLDPVINGQQNISLNGYAGYDRHLKWWEQPGAIHWQDEDVDGASPFQPHLPILAMAADILMNYWLSVDSYHIAMVVEMSNQYEAMYLGFMKPIAIDRQYPYPLVIGGGAPAGTRWADHGAAHTAYFGANGTNGVPSLVLRRPDGAWESGGATLRIWPVNTHPVDTFVVYNKDAAEFTIEDHMLFPLVLYEETPTGMLGELRGVYWIGNRADLAARDTVVHDGITYYIFNNVYDRADDAYFVMEWH